MQRTFWRVKLEIQWYNTCSAPLLWLAGKVTRGIYIYIHIITPESKKSQNLLSADTPGIFFFFFLFWAKSLTQKKNLLPFPHSQTSALIDKKYSKDSF